MRRILVLGGGFAGLWSALSAARQRDALGLGPDELEITLVNRDAWHGIRVRNYEADLSGLRVPLAAVLDPVGVRLVEAEVRSLDLDGRVVRCAVPSGELTLPYDRLVFALGSRLARPELAADAFDVDSYGGAARLRDHLAGLPAGPSSGSVLVVGAGLTGIEVAAEMVGRLPGARVVLLDRGPRIGGALGDEVTPVIERALDSLGVERRGGASIAALDGRGATLADGERIEAGTVVWCAGMQAHPLTAAFPVERDRLGRLPVTPELRVLSREAEFAAGDAAWLLLDGSHASVMSCQHSRPMGRFAGHNAVCDLFGRPLLPLRIDWYVTVLDLGAWGALYTGGWDRRVLAEGAAAKRTKETINRQRIYPPLTGDRAAILAAAAPSVQAPPDLHR